MKRTLAVVLLLCMFVTLLPGMAFAVDETPEADAAAQEAKESDVKSVFSSDLYVAPNPEAGLAARIAVKFDVIGANGTLYLPGKADASKLCFSWDDTGIAVSADGATYESGAAPVAAPGSSVTFKITKGLAFAYVTVKTVQGSAAVEPMFLELDESLGTIAAMNGDREHETSCYGKALLGDVDKYISIKGRGHSTWDFPKKPYNITFYKKNDFDKKDKAELIPGLKAKKWTLLANYLDNSMLRNKIAFDLANAMGIGLESRFVDVWMNGEYIGNYLLTPKKDYQAPDGGFMLENDHFPEAADQFKIAGMHDMLLKHNRINVEDIGDDAAAQGVDLAYIENYFNEAFSSLTDYTSENYQNYFDIDSWARMFLMFEVSKTYDCYSGNLLMRREGLTENDKLIAGPAWDYDVSFGRTLHKFLVGVAEPIQLNAEGWYNDSIGLFAVDKPVSLLQELGKHASFMRHVAEVYNEYRAAFEDIPANVDRQQSLLRDSAMMNNVLWGTQSLCADYLVSPTGIRVLGTGKYALNYQVTVDWDAYVANLREYAVKRVMWLTDHLYAEAPEGSIVKTVMPDGTVVLEVVLTAGNTANTYQWQSSEDGSTWTNIGLATTAKYLPRTDALGTTQYRCIVTNAGPEIYTNHGGSVPTYVQTILAPATVSVTLGETALEEGTLTLALNGKHVGEYTFAKCGSGWSIRNSAGKYLKPVGRVLALTDQPYAWNLSNGVFVTKSTIAVTMFGKMLTLFRAQNIYLNVVAGAPAVSNVSGAAVTLLKPVAA